MVSEILVIIIVGWAAVYSGIKVYHFIKNSGKDKPVQCSCSSCPMSDNGKCS